MGQITQCLGGKIGSLDQISNKDATILYCLSNGIKVFSVHNWALKPNQTEGPPLTDHMKDIYNLDVPVDSKAPKPSSQTKEVPQVVGEMHKDAQQVAGGPTSLGATSKEGAHPQLSSGHDASADSTAEVDPGNSVPNDSIPSQQGTNEESRADEISKKIKMEDLSDLLKYTRSSFFTPDSPQDEPNIVLDESEEEVEVDKDKDTHATSHDKDELEQQKAKAKAEVALLKSRPSYRDINQLTDLLVTSLKPKLSKLLALHNFTNCLPNALKELPSKFTKLSGEIKEFKKHVQDMEIELPKDSKEILTKLETFTSTITSISSQEKLKTFDFLPSLLNKVIDTLNRFATMVEHASEATTKDAPSAGQTTASPVEGEKNINPTTTNAEPNLKDELVNLLGIDVVTHYYNKKLLYDKYYEKMLKRRKTSKITNCDVLTQKGPISLKVHREDRIIKVISNVKVSYLHLAKWREVVQACLDRKEKGCKTIYGLIKIRMEYLDQTKK
ncbi:hypothetical protein Tco_1004457 [Tanacetum coccineum]|uniref:Uncharacterized protein n=1 Tax=Tanacetum coccineum TaxID=301880 RepID=A0ABQ5FCY2_9ASTR